LALRYFFKTVAEQRMRLDKEKHYAEFIRLMFTPSVDFSYIII